MDKPEESISPYERWSLFLQGLGFLAALGTLFFLWLQIREQTKSLRFPYPIDRPILTGWGTATKTASLIG